MQVVTQMTIPARSPDEFDRHTDITLLDDDTGVDELEAWISSKVFHLPRVKPLDSSGYTTSSKTLLPSLPEWV
jgi:hypothetical protein